MVSNIIFLVCGTLIGFLSGIFGIGGGIITFPVIYFCLYKLHYLPQNLSLSIAAATSLMITIPTLTATVIARAKDHEIKWRIVIHILPGLLFGVMVTTTWFTHVIPAHVTKIIFAVSTTLIALQFFANYTHNGHIKKTPGVFMGSFVGFIIGGLSSLLGITGGEYTASFLRYHKVKLKQVTATTAVVGLIISVSASLGFFYSSFNHEKLNIPHTIGYIYWPAVLLVGSTGLAMTYVGDKVAHHLKASILRKFFALVILITGFAMLVI